MLGSKTERKIDRANEGHDRCHFPQVAQIFLEHEQTDSNQREDQARFLAKRAQQKGRSAEPEQEELAGAGSVSGLKKKEESKKSKRGRRRISPAGDVNDRCALQ